MTKNVPVDQISDVVWEIPKSYKEGMKVPARIVVSDELKKYIEPRVIDQITNVATLPGIQKYAIALPDAHVGYGYPIGGVSAHDMEEGVISPGGIGFDINCGVRMLRTNLTEQDVKPKIKELVNELFRQVPAGVGAQGFVKLQRNEFLNVLRDGAKWCLDKEYAWESDIEHIESNGCLSQADPNALSNRAIDRGLSQLGTLGSGNHFLEIQVLKPEGVLDEKLAKTFKLSEENQVTMMIHCGSRGLGHQVGSDYLKSFLKAMPKHNLPIRDKQLACAPIQSKEGQDYYAAMACAANYAFANRQIILHRVREVFEKVFNQSAADLGLELIYDVAHNIAKIEEHTIEKKKKTLMVHRKGATRGFPPHHPEIPQDYQETGQPIILGGSMETGSYLVVGMKEGMDVSFGSTAHGAGRTMSRSQAKKRVFGKTLLKEMRSKGIYVKGASMAGLAEEAGIAYKNLDAVIDTLKRAKIGHPVVKLIPIGNVKG